MRVVIWSGIVYHVYVSSVNGFLVSQAKISFFEISFICQFSPLKVKVHR